MDVKFIDRLRERLQDGFNFLSSGLGAQRNSPNGRAPSLRPDRNRVLEEDDRTVRHGLEAFDAPGQSAQQRPVAVASVMPSRKPLMVVWGVLKSPCASIQSTPVPAPDRHITPTAERQFPERTIGNRPARREARTCSATARISSKLVWICSPVHRSRLDRLRIDLVSLFGETFSQPGGAQRPGRCPSAHCAGRNRKGQEEAVFPWT